MNTRTMNVLQQTAAFVLFALILEAIWMLLRVDVLEDVKRNKHMNMRWLGMLVLALTAAGCHPSSSDVHVSSSELRFKSHDAGVLAFDLKLRGGDMICWQHGDDGTVHSRVWETDQKTGLRVSITPKRLVISIGNSATESIPIVTARLIEKPVLREGRYLVGHYIRELGAVQTPETPLYLYLKRKE